MRTFDTDLWLHKSFHSTPSRILICVSPTSGTGSAQSLTEALQLLCQAYDSDSGSSVVLNMLAHHCLLRGDYAKVCARERDAD